MSSTKITRRKDTLAMEEDGFSVVLTVEKSGALILREARDRGDGTKLHVDTTFCAKEATAIRDFLVEKLGGAS